MTAILDTIFTREQLAVIALTNSLEYKDGWALHFSNGQFGLVAHLSAHVPDSRRERWVTFTQDWDVPEDITSLKALYDWLLRQIDDIEQHETREFFKVDGVLWDDPHAADKPPFVREGF